MYFLDEVNVKEEPVDIKEESEDSDTTETIYIVNSEYNSDLLIKTEPDDSDFFDSNIRRRRVSDNDDSERTGLCHVCGKTVSRMTPHMRRHNMSYKCKQCPMGFSNMKELNKHMRDHEHTIYCCTNCSSYFSTPLDLCRHQVKHFNEYRCIFCEFSTSHLSVITLHLNRHEKTLIYECDECGRGFSTEYLMKTHKQIHSGIKRYKCDFCQKKFATENYKNCHMKYNHSEELTGVKNIYKCRICYREFSFEKSLTRHLSVIHNIGVSRKVECPICSKVIANSFNLKMHMSVHTGEKHHVCELCGKAFRDRGHLKRHNNVHLKRGEEMYLLRRRRKNILKIEIKSEIEDDSDWLSEPKKSRRKPRTNVTWSCKKCLEDFSTRKLLQAHKKIHVREDSPTTQAMKNYKFDEALELYICNLCSAEYQEEHEITKHISNNHIKKFNCDSCMQTFTEPYKFSVHSQKHIGGDFFCPLCTYHTPRMTCIQSHINRMHLQKFIYNCKTCGKGFNDQAIFREHDNEHLGIKPFTCVVCNKSYVFSKYLFAHQVRYHVVNIEGRLQNNQCGICMRIFAKDSTLEKHMKNRHENYGVPREKKLLCDICGQGFSRNDKLKIHYRIHTGVKPYVCSYCPKSFIKKEYLVMHERVHNGERPYSCEYCGKCFNQSAPLRIHVRGHTGEKPYICQICEQGFISRSSLNFHRKNYCAGRQEELL